MKRFLISFLMCVLCFSAYAGGDKPVLLVENVYSGAVATATLSNLNGYVQQLYVDVPTMTTWTGVVSLATAYETIYTNTFSADAMKRPFVMRETIAGAVSNSVDRFFLYNDTITATITVTSTGMVAKTVPITIYLTDK